MMRRLLRTLFPAILALVLTTPFLSGCSTPCTYPDQREVKIRVLNAMPDQEVITVFLNGKLLVKDFAYDPQQTFGYFTTYDNGTPLEVGVASKVTITSDAAGKNVIFRDSVNIDFHSQTLIIMGKAHNILPSDPNTKKILRLADDIQTPDPTRTLMRFVHAIPDLPALDVYWKRKPDGTPNLTISYGVENPYVDLSGADTLKITEAGKPENIVFLLPYKAAASIPDLVATTVVRGESKPYGRERIVSTLLLSDSKIGNYILNDETFGVRLVNGSRSLTLNLLIRGLNETLPRGNYPNQDVVENIPPESVSSKYLPLLPSIDNNARYWFSADMAYPNIDTLLSFNSPTPFEKDTRHTIIAVENKKLNESGRSLDSMILIDTMTAQPGMGRVRIIDLSPDHATISFTLNGKSVTMSKKDVLFFDVSTGTQTLDLHEGTVSKNASFIVPLGRPISLYLMPATATDNFPIVTSDD